MKLVKNIVSKTGVTHFKRWCLLKTPWFTVYLDNLRAQDEDHPHQHPWDFVSVILFGAALERVWKDPNKLPSRHMLSFGKIIKRGRFYYHHIYLVRPIWALTFRTNKASTLWGYFYNGSWINHAAYRRLKRDNKLDKPSHIS